MATGDICVIRNARPDDCEDIMSMIKGLIHQELKLTDRELKFSDEVRLDANTLRRDGFGTHKLFHCFVVEDKTSDGKLVGFALCLLHYCCQEGRYAYGKMIYVDPNYRSNKIGDRLMREMAKFAVQSGCNTLKWNTYTWKKVLIAGYERRGGENCTKSEGATAFRLYEEQLRQLVDSPRGLEDKILIRKARPEDGEEILTLAKEQAALNKQPTNAITLDASTFRQDGFGQAQLFHCFVAEDSSSGGKVLGYALFFLHNGYLGISTFLEELCISPNHRQMGIEGRLLQQVAREAIQTGYMPLDFVGFESDEDTMEFMESNGAINRTRIEGLIRFRIRGEKLIQFAAAQSDP